MKAMILGLGLSLLLAEAAQAVEKELPIDCPQGVYFAMEEAQISVAEDAYLARPLVAMLIPQMVLVGYVGEFVVDLAHGMKLEAGNRWRESLLLPVRAILTAPLGTECMLIRRPNVKE